MGPLRTVPTLSMDQRYIPGLPANLSRSRKYSVKESTAPGCGFFAFNLPPDNARLRFQLRYP